MQVGDELYRKTLRRWNTLNWLDNPTARQRAERERLGAELDAAELAHSRRSVINVGNLSAKVQNDLRAVATEGADLRAVGRAAIAAIANDYDECMQLYEAGNLGQVEL